MEESALCICLLPGVSSMQIFISPALPAHHLTHDRPRGLAKSCLNSRPPGLQAASWAEPCNGAVDMSQQCSSACRAAVASDSVSRDCFYNFLANSFFGTPPPSRSTVDAFYTECTTPVPPPPPPPSAAPATVSPVLAGCCSCQQLRGHPAGLLA